jgi:hypothetical protein
VTESRLSIPLPELGLDGWPGKATLHLVGVVICGLSAINQEMTRLLDTHDLRLTGIQKMFESYVKITSSTDHVI